MYVCVCEHACACMCVYACEHACVCICVYACVHLLPSLQCLAQLQSLHLHTDTDTFQQVRGAQPIREVRNTYNFATSASARDTATTDWANNSQKLLPPAAV